jgi:hypothetical protein
MIVWAALRTAAKRALFRPDRGLALLKEVPATAVHAAPAKTARRVCFMAGFPLIFGLAVKQACILFIHNTKEK